MSGSNAYFSKQLLPTPTKDICADPQKLADYLSKMQLRLNQDLRRVRIIKCPTCVIDSVNSGDPETLVEITNPGFKIGALFFSHAVFLKRVSGLPDTPPIQSFSGFLRNLRFTTEGGAVFNPVIQSSPVGKLVWDVYVVAIEGDSTLF